MTDCHKPAMEEPGEQTGAADGSLTAVYHFYQHAPFTGLVRAGAVGCRQGSVLISSSSSEGECGTGCCVMTHVAPPFQSGRARVSESRQGVQNGPQYRKSMQIPTHICICMHAQLESPTGQPCNTHIACTPLGLVLNLMIARPLHAHTHNIVHGMHAAKQQTSAFIAGIEVIPCTSHPQQSSAHPPHSHPLAV